MNVLRAKPMPSVELMTVVGCDAHLGSPAGELANIAGERANVFTDRNATPSKKNGFDVALQASGGGHWPENGQAALAGSLGRGTHSRLRQPSPLSHTHNHSLSHPPSVSISISPSRARAHTSTAEMAGRLRELHHLHKYLVNT